MPGNLVDGLPSNGLRISCAALIERESIWGESDFQNGYDLGARSGIGCNHNSQFIPALNPIVPIPNGLLRLLVHIYSFHLR